MLFLVVQNVLFIEFAYACNDELSLSGRRLQLAAIVACVVANIACLCTYSFMLFHSRLTSDLVRTLG